MTMITTLSYGQILITELADPIDKTTCRYVELFNLGDTEVDLSLGYKIQRYTNGATTPQKPVELSGVIPAKGFYIIARSGFNGCFGFTPSQILPADGPADSNGDDQIQILDPNDNVIDIFGVIGEKGTGTCHEFFDGRAERIASVDTGNNGTWSEENWNTWTATATEVSCTNRNSNHSVSTTDNLYDPGSWIGAPSISFESIGVSVSESQKTIDVCVTINTLPTGQNTASVELNLDAKSTAINGSDFVQINFPQTFTFSSDSEKKECITISFIENTTPSPMKSIILNLKNSISSILGPIITYKIEIEAHDLTCPKEGDIIFSEIMQNPDKVSDDKGEWFELYNTTSDPIDLFGMEIIDDNHTILEEGFPIDKHLIIPVDGYVLFANNGDSEVNGGLPTPDFVYDYSFLTLGNGTDGIRIVCQGADVNKVVWDNGSTFPDPTGASMSLMKDKHNYENNAFGESWEEAVYPYGDGDLGTPRERNYKGGDDGDGDLSIAKNEVDALLLYPNPVAEGNFVVTTKKTGNKELLIYNVSGKQVFRQAFKENKLSVDVSNFDKGLYIVHLLERTGMSTTKIVIK